MRNLVLFLLIFMTIFGFLAWAQKSREEVPEDQGITLTDLGVTEAEKSELRLLWELKRQKQIQAIESLKKLNRLAKDPMTPIDETRLRGVQRKNVAAEETRSRVTPVSDSDCTRLTVNDNPSTMNQTPSGSVRGSGDRPGLQTQCGG